MDLGHIVVILLITIILFIITHLRPLNEREITKLSHKKRKEEIKRYFSFDNSEYYVDKEFKRKMRPDGKFYHSFDELIKFPSIAAGLLKYKKHEWIIIAFEKNKVIDLLWLNKGFDRTCVSSALSAHTLLKISRENDYTSVLIFHNHPNSDPDYYDCSKPSDQDVVSAQSYSNELNRYGINVIEFVCERGRHYQYFSSITESFLPLKGFMDSIAQKNGRSWLQNLLLHIERFI